LGKNEPGEESKLNASAGALAVSESALTGSSDDSSRIQQIGLVMMGASLPPLQWKTLGGSFVTMTPVLAGQIFQTTAANDVAIFTRAERHRALMMGTPNPTAYNFLGGWPPTFGE
jgi:hypothetical protein